MECYDCGTVNLLEIFFISHSSEHQVMVETADTTEQKKDVNEQQKPVEQQKPAEPVINTATHNKTVTDLKVKTAADGVTALNNDTVDKLLGNTLPESPLQVDPNTKIMRDREGRDVIEVTDGANKTTTTYGADGKPVIEEKSDQTARLAPRRSPMAIRLKRNMTQPANWSAKTPQPPTATPLRCGTTRRPPEHGRLPVERRLGQYEFVVPVRRQQQPHVDQIRRRLGPFRCLTPPMVARPETIPRSTKWH